NLLPHEIRFERMVRAKKPWAVAAAALLLAAVGFLGIARAVERSAWTDPNITKYLKEGKNSLDAASGYDKEVERLEGEAKATHETVLRVAAGVNERFNWNLLYRYVSDAIPT